MSTETTTQTVFPEAYAEVLRARVKQRMAVEDRGYTTPCWISNRAAAGSGGAYTKIGVRLGTWDYAIWYTHRLSYVLFVGDIPEGLVVDHRCEQKKCCNPSHLAAVTQRENLLRSDAVVSLQRAQEECLRGHRFDEANTRTDKNGKRSCRACTRSRRRRTPSLLRQGLISRDDVPPTRPRQPFGYEPRKGQR